MLVFEKWSCSTAAHRASSRGFSCPLHCAWVQVNSAHFTEATCAFSPASYCGWGTTAPIWHAGSCTSESKGGNPGGTLHQWEMAANGETIFLPHLWTIWRQSGFIWSLWRCLVTLSVVFHQALASSVTPPCNTPALPLSLPCPCSGETALPKIVLAHKPFLHDLWFGDLRLRKQWSLNKIQCLLTFFFNSVFPGFLYFSILNLSYYSGVEGLCQHLRFRKLSKKKTQAQALGSPMPKS